MNFIHCAFIPHDLLPSVQPQLKILPAGHLPSSLPSSLLSFLNDEPFIPFLHFNYPLSARRRRRRGC